MNKGLVSLIAVVAVLWYGFHRFEKQHMTAKEIALIAALAALAAVSRIPFAFIPGVQPTTFLVILTGYVFGFSAGFFAGTSAALVSNIFLGHGPWTIWQMLGWGACGVSAALLGKTRPHAGTVSIAIFSGLWGFLFGWVVNFWYWYSFVHPLSVASWLALNTASFPFDAMHAFGNVALVVLLGRRSITTLRFFQKRIAVTYLS